MQICERDIWKKNELPDLLARQKMKWCVLCMLLSFASVCFVKFETFFQFFTFNLAANIISLIFEM